MAEPIRISPKQLQIEKEGATRGSWYVRVPAEHTIEQVLDPAYFGQCVEYPKKLQVPDVIEVEPEDLSWSLYLTVLSVDAKTRRVVTRLKGQVDRFTVELPADAVKAGFDVRYIGKEAGWGVFNGKDLVDQGFKTQTGAIERLSEITAKKAA